MKRAVLVVLGLVLLPGADRKDDARKDVKRLQGTWVMKSLEIDGKPVPEEKIKDTTLTVKGDRYIVKTRGKMYESTFKLDPGKTPKAIDMFLPNGTDAPKKSEGIYKLEGDTFTLCRAQAAGQDRPTQFGTWPDTGVFMVVWERQKP